MNEEKKNPKQNLLSLNKMQTHAASYQFHRLKKSARKKSLAYLASLAENIQQSALA
jgi:hypothetical protein